MVSKINRIILLAFCLTCITFQCVTATADTVQKGEYNPKFDFRKQQLSMHSWFYSAILPVNNANTKFYALSLSPDSVHPKPKQPQKTLSSPQWIDLWKNGSENIGSVRVGNYDYARDIPHIVQDKNESYLFFLQDHRTLTSDSPVLRVTPGGDAWQTLNSVAPDILHQVLSLDFGDWKVYDATGKSISDIGVLKSHFTNKSQLVSFTTQSDRGNIKGLFGNLAPITDDTTKSRSPLPYSKTYFYSMPVKGAPVIYQLQVVDPASKILSSSWKKFFENVDITSPESTISFGMPVLDFKNGTHVFYWYCIQDLKDTHKMVFILASYDGKNTIPIDAFKVRTPFPPQYWTDSQWVEAKTNYAWLYGRYIDASLQPLVGFDSDGNLVVYRPPDFYTYYRLNVTAVDAHDLDNRDHQNRHVWAVNKSTPKRLLYVMIDPGHGRYKRTDGTIGWRRGGVYTSATAPPEWQKLHEDDTNLALAFALQRRLVTGRNNQTNYRVRLTRENVDDLDENLVFANQKRREKVEAWFDEKAQYYQDHNIDLIPHVVLIAIHTNSAEDKTVHGTNSFYKTTAAVTEASQTLASKIQNRLVSMGGRVGRSIGGKNYTIFGGDNPHIPCVLTEVLFHSNVQPWAAGVTPEFDLLRNGVNWTNGIAGLGGAVSYNDSWWGFTMGTRAMRYGINDYFAARRSPPK